VVERKIEIELRDQFPGERLAEDGQAGAYSSVDVSIRVATKQIQGEVSERSKEHAWKACIR
jgi:hypothetical protein